MRNPTATLTQPAAEGAQPPQSDRIVFLGHSEDGVALEVMAIEVDDDALLVIHAMRMRAKYAHHLKRGDDDGSP